ncbi:deoxyribose-phosphate aldolase [Basidiobolus meristosporus CBS 931.73]|uniref:deoxyribose-phosphate aldolase n=1 Tax=Basidiobolus meristosporus CBS 931.73 TaxID=1314790 RepID=A0A1Y1YJJ9_9FUNG|nr:deoxyribose-phosphate aldolase [Basidiobolus meristosporus CBS 931.73]|eukprot:ORX97936.1 deoxyribose-phosphate aldolase [Basidiobolus meristosporus CBS 931.73]
MSRSALLQTASAQKSSPLYARLGLATLDLTSLNDNDTDAVITDLCQRALSSPEPVAALCVYAQFTELARRILKENNYDAGIATVVNFPYGTNSVEQVVAETKACLDNVDEVDLVWPFEKYIQGDKEAACNMISEVKKTIVDYNRTLSSGRKPVLLKVILETSAFPAELVYDACIDAIHAGADFLKTSTGKHSAGGATLEVAYDMLRAIKDTKEKEGQDIRLKISGGVKTVEQAGSYIWLAEKMMTGTDEALVDGKEDQRWVNAKNFRIGASGVFSKLVNVLAPGKEASSEVESGY